SETQAASAIVKAGSTTPVTVKATPPPDVTAGAYPITVDVTSGSRTAHADLSVEVTGSYTIKLTTPDARLSASASAGTASDLTLVVQNTGTAPVTGVVPSATAPQGWTITFDPATVDIAPQGEATVVANMTPSSDAIAGDYLVSFKATSDLASSSADIRVTIQTGLLGGAIGLGLIVLVLVGLGWVFLRYGRR
ncbi:MAG: NEW3 domain-containing protein, partial [Chloroflexota bacterium]|nr:NEW3 domain-containing protein [Chloroflexota bacterium]